MVNRLKMIKQTKLCCSKEKLQRLYFNNKDKVNNSHDQESGDGDIDPGPCCRLCGSDQCLWGVQDRCMSEGVEESFEQLLYECFGVKVTPEDSKICDHCIGQLMSAYKFRALVHAAFMKTTSRGSSCISTNEIEEDTPAEIVESSIADIRLHVTSDQSINKTIINIYDHKTNNHPKRMLKRSVAKNVSPKKAFVCCCFCGQKYPIMMHVNSNEFVCSRCKLKQNIKCDMKKCNLVSKKDVTKDDCKVKNRLRSQKKPSQAKNSDGNKAFYLIKQIKAGHIKPVKQNMNIPFLL